MLFYWVFIIYESFKLDAWNKPTKTLLAKTHLYNWIENLLDCDNKHVRQRSLFH